MTEFKEKDEVVYRGVHYFVLAVGAMFDGDTLLQLGDGFGNWKGNAPASECERA